MMHCSHCGEPNPESASFCDSCGQQMPEPRPTAERTDPPSNSVSWRSTLMAVIALGLLLGLLAAWLVSREAEQAPAGVSFDAGAGDFVMISELWDGRELTRDIALLEAKRIAPGRFEAEVQAVSLVHEGQPIALAGVGGTATASLDGGRPLDRPSPHLALAGALVRELERSGVASDALQIRLPSNDGLRTLGSLPVSLVSQRLDNAGRRWHQVSLPSEPAQIARMDGSGAVETRVRGVFVWDQDGHELAVAELWLSQRHGDTLAWSRLSLQATDPSLDVRPFLDPSVYLPPVVTAGDARIGALAAAELQALNRSAFLEGAAQAEQAANPVLLTALAAVHLADSAWTLGANLGHDLALRSRGIEQPLNPFDGDVESPLERYVYRNLARGGASVAADLGLVEHDKVDAYAYHAGKVLHIAGGVAGGLSVSSVASGAVGVGSQHAAHVIWGHSAHVGAGAQAALVGLGRAVCYGGQALHTAMDIAEKTHQAHELAEAFLGLYNTATTGGSAVEQPRAQLPDPASALQPSVPSQTPQTTPANPLSLLTGAGLAELSDMPRVRVRPDAVAARVVLVIDKSGSMRSGEGLVAPIEQARRAVRLVASVLRPQDQLALVPFSSGADTLRPLLPVGASPARLEPLVRQLTPGGGTSFQAALTESVSVARTAGAPPPHVLFVSDGKSSERDLGPVLRTLGNLGVQLHAIPVGEVADQDTLCSMAEALDGWCVPITDAGLKETLIQLLDTTRGMRTLAQIRDVIRPGEVQRVALDMPANAVDEQAGIQIAGSWMGSDLAFVARSPSGAVYSTDAPGDQAYASGGAASAFRVLMVPFEAGAWVLEAEGRDVPSSGEAYAMTISAASRSELRLETLSDRYRPGQQVDVTLEGCRGGKAVLHGPVGVLAESALQASGGECRVPGLTAPSEAGFYPLALHATDGAGRPITTWTTLPVGSLAEVVSRRDQWRAPVPAWSMPSGGGSGGSWIVLLVVAAIGGLVVFMLAVRNRGSSPVERIRAAGAGAPSDGSLGLMVHAPGTEPASVPLGRDVVRIGRAPDNDVIMDVPEVSRHHLLLERGSRGWSVLNLSRSEASQLDGELIPADRAVPLRPGATIRLAGGVLLWLE